MEPGQTHSALKQNCSCLSSKAAGPTDQRQAQITPEYAKKAKDLR